MKKINGLVVLLLLLCLTGCSAKKIDVGAVVGTSQMVTQTVNVSLINDYSDVNVLVSATSYVFVGRVEEYLKTSSSDSGSSTYYGVRVLQNIKGELITDRNITLRKCGGLLKNSDVFMVYSGDILPKVGGTYIFSTYVNAPEDDFIYCSGPFTTLEIDESDYLSSDLYLQFVEACKHPVELLGNQSALNNISIFDVNYK